MDTTINISKAFNALPETINRNLKSFISPLKTFIKSDDKNLSKQATNNAALPHLTATLTRVKLETHDTKSYFFQIEKPLNEYKAGAHINIAFDANGKTINRTYTLSSSPELGFNTTAPKEFSITVKRVNEGLASNWLFENLIEGKQISVSQPQGSFVLPYQPAGKLLMLSAGSGITPLMSMLRYLAQTGNRSNIIFLHYAQSDDDIIFHDELKQLSTEKENITTYFSVEKINNTSIARLSNDTHQGRISKNQLSAIVPDVHEREIYLCGPQPFMKATVEILDQVKFKPSQLHLENFTADLSAATQLGYSAKLSFSSLAESIQSSPSRTILEEAEAAGLKPASACRTGICRSCRCKKTSGTTVNLMTGEESNGEGDYILPCVSVAKTATTIEL
ncbi:MAG: ferredoxin-NADP reductase [Oleiphilaceae bacterium]|jgi:ferredoxin-NADP reductase